MKLEELLASLSTLPNHGVSQVSGVQASNCKASGRYPSQPDGVSGVSPSRVGWRADTPDTSCNPAGVSDNPFNINDVSPDTPDTPKNTNNAIRVYQYRLGDTPEVWLTMLAPYCDMDEARHSLRLRFGADRLLDVRERCHETGRARP